MFNSIQSISRSKKILLVFIAIFLYRYAKKVAMNRKVADIRKRAHERKARMREEFFKWIKTNNIKVPSEAERTKILTKSSCDLVNDMKHKRVKVADVMLTMCLRSIAADDKLACTNDEMYLEALQKAIELDIFLKTHGPEDCGPMFGLPVSLKEQLAYIGTDNTCGIAHRFDHPSDCNAPLVWALIKNGAIPFVKTNVPQVMLLPESINNVWGTTLNPWDLSRCAGGSSGGEGALIGSGASPLGIGTDIGGSIRIPAHYCGISGFKPTPGRVSSKLSHSPASTHTVGQRIIVSVPGPMAKYVEDLKLCMQTLLKPGSALYEEDPVLLPLTYREKTEKRKMVIGYFEMDGYFDAAPSCRRAVLEAKAALEREGHTLIPFKVPGADEFVKLMIAANSSDGKFANMTSDLRGEPLVDRYDRLYGLAQIPRSFKWILAGILKMLGNYRQADLVSFSGERSVLSYWRLTERVEAYRYEFIAAMKAQRIEALLSPGGTLPAMRPGESTELFISCSSTFLYNVLHFPAGTVPVTVTRKDETTYESNVNDRLTYYAKKSLKGTEGLPVGVQIAGLPWQDEICLDLMQDLENQVQFHKHHQIPNQF